MRKIKRVLIMVVIAVLMSPCMASAGTKSGDTQNKTISIIFSHDMHSHIEKFAKISTIIKNAKEENKSTFILDGGDFSMGTPYQTIFKSEAAELRMMGEVGYDVTTLGNHEFDYRSEGLRQMLERACRIGGKLPQIVISNIDWDNTLSDNSLAEDGNRLQAALDNYGAHQKYSIIEKDGLRIAVFGIFGKESASYAPESGTLFSDPVETAKKIVQDIKNHERVDLIVCLSHSGTNQKNQKKSEDEILADKVDGIDLIISGHSHTYLEKPIIKNNTVIASVGEYNDNIGSLSFTYKDSKWQLEKYRVIPLDSSISDDRRTLKKIEYFKDKVNSEYFSKFDYSWDDLLTSNNIDFTPIEELGLKQGEDTLGNLISDSYIYGVKNAEGETYRNVDVAIAPLGIIRASFAKGRITVGDAFDVLSLGSGVDGTPGYPLVSVYLTGSELKTVAEVDASVSDIMLPARLYISGLNYKYNPHRIILDKAYDIYIDKGNGEKAEIDNGKLYRVVADLYSAQMLATVNSMSHGILAVAPKDKEGHIITNFEKQIIYNADGSELKEWYALASYMDSFQGSVPEYYSETHNRKTLVDSRKLSDIFKKPGRYFKIIVAAATLIIAVIALIIIFILKLYRKLKHKRSSRKRKKRKSRLKNKDMLFNNRMNKY